MPGLGLNLVFLVALVVVIAALLWTVVQLTRITSDPGVARDMLP